MSQYFIVELLPEIFDVATDFNRLLEIHFIVFKKMCV